MVCVPPGNKEITTMRKQNKFMRLTAAVLVLLLLTTTAAPAAVAEVTSWASLYV